MESSLSHCCKYLCNSRPYQRRVAFGPQPHDRLASQCSAIHAVSALPEKKKYILGIPHLKPCATLSDSRPSISGHLVS